VRELAEPLPADAIVAALEAIGTTHVVTVPDTHQRTVLARLAEPGRPPVVRAATELDVLGICAGLWMAGRRPVALVQQLGLFASVNALRAFTHDQHVPLAILAGLYGRDTSRAVHDESQVSAVRLMVPLLSALGVRYALIEQPSEADLVRRTLAAAFEEGCTSVALLGAPTA
jgi:sulfopyruvate decarboxylase TPP-binding subunit